jgi:hypothetical protein
VHQLRVPHQYRQRHPGASRLDHRPQRHAPGGLTTGRVANLPGSRQSFQRACHASPSRSHCRRLSDRYASHSGNARQPASFVVLREGARRICAGPGEAIGPYGLAPRRPLLGDHGRTGQRDDRVGARRSATPDTATPCSDIAPNRLRNPSPRSTHCGMFNTQKPSGKAGTGQSDVDPSVPLRRSASSRPVTLARAQIRVAPTPILGRMPRSTVRRVSRGSCINSGKLNTDVCSTQSCPQTPFLYCGFRGARCGDF